MVNMYQSLPDCDFIVQPDMANAVVLILNIAPREEVVLRFVKQFFRANVQHANICQYLFNQLVRYFLASPNQLKQLGLDVLTVLSESVLETDLSKAFALVLTVPLGRRSGSSKTWCRWRTRTPSCTRF